ncbi:MAG: PIN domain-containing protein [Candidatus Aenigmarchaeota archaeon]|nr:PIN domain-containing protein [Candidatus Aenigmarchaeota archaeon]
MIVDTAFVIDIMRKDEKAVIKLRQLVSRGEPQIMTTLTLFELYSGIMQSNKPDVEKQKVLQLLSNLIIWHFDAESAKKSGEIDGSLCKQGKKIDAIDSMIAGIAIAKGETLLARNIKDFSKIVGLDAESY